MGVVSLLADFTYEGGRSILGPYLALLSASPFVIGFLSGLSELVGYLLRLVSGYLSDKLKRPWAFVFFGLCYKPPFCATPRLGAKLAMGWCLDGS
jgi:hypothetical protein